MILTINEFKNNIDVKIINENNVLQYQNNVTNISQLVYDDNFKKLIKCNKVKVKIGLSMIDLIELDLPKVSKKLNQKFFISYYRKFNEKQGYLIDQYFTKKDNGYKVTSLFISQKLYNGLKELINGSFTFIKPIEKSLFNKHDLYQVTICDLDLYVTHQKSLLFLTSLNKNNFTYICQLIQNIYYQKLMNNKINIVSNNDDLKKKLYDRLSKDFSEDLIIYE